MKKSMSGSLVDKNNPVSMDEIMKELKKDRKASDRNFDYIQERAGSSKKFSRHRFNRKSLMAYVNRLLTNAT